LIPKFIEKFEKRGLIIPKTLFSNEALTAAPAAAAQAAPELKKVAGGK
jgi:hypothetical protein